MGRIPLRMREAEIRDALHIITNVVQRSSFRILDRDTISLPMSNDGLQEVTIRGARGDTDGRGPRGKNDHFLRHHKSWAQKREIKQPRTDARAQ